MSLITSQRLSDDELLALIQSMAHLTRAVDAIAIALPEDDYDAQAGIASLRQGVEHVGSFIQNQATA